MDTGWIKLHRKILENPIFTSNDSYLIHLWIYILLSVNHKEKKVLFNQKEFVIKKGSGIFGLNQMVKDLTIYKKENSKNFKRMKSIYYRRLKTLALLKNIELKTTNKFTIITVIQWNKYQQTELKRNSSGTQTELKRKTKITNKNEEKEKNDNNDKKITKDNFKQIYILFNFGKKIRIIPDINSKSYKNYIKALEKLSIIEIEQNVTDYLDYLLAATWRKKKSFEAWFNNSEYYANDWKAERENEHKNPKNGKQQDGTTAEELAQTFIDCNFSD